jgi:hypothetical protein
LKLLPKLVDCPKCESEGVVWSFDRPRRVIWLECENEHIYTMILAKGLDMLLEVRS